MSLRIVLHLWVMKFLYKELKHLFVHLGCLARLPVGTAILVQLIS